MATPGSCPGSVFPHSHPPLGEEAELLQCRPVRVLAREGKAAVGEAEEAERLVVEQERVAVSVVQRVLPEIEPAAGEVGPALGLGFLGAGCPRGKLELPGVLGLLSNRSSMGGRIAPVRTSLYAKAARTAAKKNTRKRGKGYTK